MADRVPARFSHAPACEHQYNQLLYLLVGLVAISEFSLAYLPTTTISSALVFGLGRGGQRRFWENLDEVVHGIPRTEKLFMGEDFNGHIGAMFGGYDDVHVIFDFGIRNGGGTSLLDFAKAFDLVISNSSYQVGSFD
nr:uncharacterized protein LOC104108324 [Nicotiana tomentosiformis]